MGRERRYVEHLRREDAPTIGREIIARRSSPERPAGANTRLYGASDGTTCSDGCPRRLHSVPKCFRPPLHDRLFNVQVKTSNLNKFATYVFDIRVSSFERHNSSSTFYAFVLRDDERRDFLVVPFFELAKRFMSAQCER